MIPCILSMDDTSGSKATVPGSISTYGAAQAHTVKGFFFQNK